MYNGATVKTYALPPVNVQEVLRYAGCKTHDETLITQIKECEKQAHLSPRVCFARFSAQTLIDTFKESKLVSLRLKDCSQAVVFVATVGLEIDRLILKN